MARRARAFVVSGPSGVGKGTLVALLRDRVSCLGLTVSATTREPRDGERDGVSYHFMDDAEFDRRLAAGEFLEWAWVHAHRYGTLKSEVERVLAGGESVVLEIDVQGGLAVRAAMPDAVLVFIEPPSMDELERRLRGRGTEDEEQVALRLANARSEMARAPEYDVRIVNDDLDRACRELQEVIHTYEMDGGPSQDVRDQARD
uniref:guanylate kinase n=1 Tax=Olsenella timonensis TaxID=1805478 RepID=UPI00094E0303|nr:guanylate kinase [Olsenella timonensis]